MIDWLKRFITGKILKGYLDKLPFNGYKTYITVVVYVAIKATQGFCLAATQNPMCVALSWLPSVLDLDLSTMTDEAAGATLVSFFVFLGHKVLKWMHKEEELPPAKQ